MYCFMCGEDVNVVRVTSDREIKTGDVTVFSWYEHCNMTWVVNDQGMITACGEKKGKQDATEKTNQA